MFLFSFKQLVLFLDCIYDRFIFYGGIAWNNKILIIKKSIIKIKKKIIIFFYLFIYFFLEKIKGTCFYFIGFIIILVLKFTFIGFIF